MQLEFVHLHAPLFLAGTNLGDKLDPTKRSGIKLELDRDAGELLVGWNHKVAIVPLSNVISMVAAPQSAPSPAAKAPAAIVGSAQVSTPQGHVHAGPGAGVTGQEERKAPKGSVVL